MNHIVMQKRNGRHISANISSKLKWGDMLKNEDTIYSLIKNIHWMSLYISTSYNVEFHGFHHMYKPNWDPEFFRLNGAGF